jgi:hypothetical protein
LDHRLLIRVSDPLIPPLRTIVDKINTENVASPYPSVSPSRAIIAAEHGYKGLHNGHPTKLEYYAKPDGSVALVHVVQIQNDKAGTWVEVYVDAHSSDIVGSTNFVAESGVSLAGFLLQFLVLIVLFIVQGRTNRQAVNPRGFFVRLKPPGFEGLASRLAQNRQTGTQIYFVGDTS